ncbi:hypothetical protein SAMN06295974_3756 [Plantibacter flavus]|uniref:Uncharacterized protein n=1 Tax=Plantibacter flavus TaxID=150123 RepID=A0A3N2BLI2_9MICO|nr:hypothetical protein [Plantibacter flavus]ROR76096.1 hypothetical protein EDD42_4049 [Plantibacter flavus]SMG48577.1 hypothetical protein SAMN06295974_3756 [Plantibacter flavus]
MANTQKLAGIRCPSCLESQRFAIQTTINVIVEDDGFDFMASQPADDAFPGRVVDEDDGLQDDDPIVCANRNGCGHLGTVREFRSGLEAAERELMLTDVR